MLVAVPNFFLKSFVLLDLRGVHPENFKALASLYHTFLTGASAGSGQYQCWC